MDGETGDDENVQNAVAGDTEGILLGLLDTVRIPGTCSNTLSAVS